MNLQENKKMFRRVSFISVNMNDFQSTFALPKQIYVKLATTITN